MTKKTTTIKKTSPKPASTNCNNTIHSTMNKLELSLNSSLDDIPILILSTEDANLKMVSYPDTASPDKKICFWLSLGNVGINTVTLKRIYPD